MGTILMGSFILAIALFFFILDKTGYGKRFFGEAWDSE